MRVVYVCWSNSIHVALADAFLRLVVYELFTAAKQNGIDELAETKG